MQFLQIKTSERMLGFNLATKTWLWR